MIKDTNAMILRIPKKLAEFFFLIFLFTMFCYSGAAQEMDKMWGASGVKNENKTADRVAFFDYSNYAMFIHWGIYSRLGNEWNGKIYYGAAEWLMNPRVANIPVEEYKKTAADFNPKDFDAYKIAQLAKDAGMKYIVFTSKHHDGFAMYDSKACDFNIVKQTPFGRDPMKELSKACKELGLGLGFYYSHNQDWTYPGGGGGPEKDAAGKTKTFDDYFKEKCLPQVEEITTRYGDIALVWFDTPGNMPQKYAKQLVETVHRNQPKALVSGRVGYNLGDYKGFGDMEIPLKNIDGLWEGIDVTNDSWGFTWYDQNWKTPKQILSTLISTVARGGTFMLNVGPDASGKIPEPAQKALRAAGKWIAAHPGVIYGAGASPWKHALPWGDVTTNGNNIYLSIYQWPQNGKLYVPGVLFDVSDIRLPDGQNKKLRFKKEGNWLVIDVPAPTQNELVSVIKVVPKNKLPLEIDATPSVDPELGLSLSALFSTVQNGSVNKIQWMEKFGEWKTQYAVDNWKNNPVVSWQVEIKTPGYYAVSLKYKGEGRLVWKVANEEGATLNNQLGASNAFSMYPVGWMEFKKAGKQTISVSLLEQGQGNTALAELQLTPVKF